MLALLATLATLASQQAAQAMPVQWRSANFKYTADGKPLKDVLRDFGASQGMAVAVSADIDGSVAGRFDLTPPQFIDLLALSYGFVYYYNGAVLHISSAKGMRSTLVRLNAAHIRDLREALNRMKVSEPRFPIVYDEHANTALVVGPQEYVDVIREMATQLEKRTESGGRAETRVFPLQYAWAAERGTGGGGAALPGVAAILQALYGSSGGGISSGAKAAIRASNKSTQDTIAMMVGDGRSNDQVAPQLGDAKGQGGGLPALPSGGGGFDLRSALGMGSSSSSKGGGTTAFQPTPDAKGKDGSSLGGDGKGRDEDLPVILADPSSNSVIVRDLPERLPAYEALIRTLDTQPRMVEIEVQILDVNNDALTEFGVDWSLRTGRADLQTGDATRSGLSGLPGVATATPAGGVLTAVLGNSAGRALLARVSALSQSGRARVNARPKVATLNNVAAVMSSEKSFYVKVAGYQTAQLYNVSAGLNLKVTPMATLGIDGYRIRLDVQVEDGQISGVDKVEGLPLVTRSQISTQAFVNQNESLLLAGYAVEEEDERTTGLPGLSQIPFLGAVFRQRNSTRSHSERLFLVTPRVLD